MDEEAAATSSIFQNIARITTLEVNEDVAFVQFLSVVSKQSEKL